MAACKAKPVPRRVEGGSSGRQVNPTMDEMVLSAIRGCRDPTGMTVYMSLIRYDRLQ